MEPNRSPSILIVCWRLRRSAFPDAASSARKSLIVRKSQLCLKLLRPSSRQTFLQHLVDVRFNGVSTSCTKKRNGKIKMEVEAGLKAVRAFADKGEADVAIIGMAIAILGPDDKMVSNEAFGYRIGFGSGVRSQLSNAEFDLVVDADQRAVLMLTPTL